MPPNYAPLPMQQSSTDQVDRELDEAFESDADDDGDGDHLQLQLQLQPTSDTPNSTLALSYDFERNYHYDSQPPGSPTHHPLATTFTAHTGNSITDFTTSPSASIFPRPSFFRRAAGAILPTHYTRIPTNETHILPRGGATQNDGVFSNVVAKPASSTQLQPHDEGIYMVPEETQSTAPPSYAAAQADAVPTYWDTIVHAPAGVDSDAGMVVGDLPSGSILAFLSNLFISFFFQFIGFLLTYTLHTTHAAKFGSRAGLGLTIIQYGFYSRSAVTDDMLPSPDNNVINEDSILSSPPSSSAPTPPDNNFVLNMSSREWLSFLLMTLGWFLLLSSLIGFWRVKNWESAIRASNAHEPQSPEDIARDIATRRNIEQVFNIPPLEEDEHTSPGSPWPLDISTPRDLTEADLRAAGVL